MRIDLVPIGNSKGVRLPKVLLAQCGFTGSAELEVRDGTIVLRPVTAPRQGWAEAAKALAEEREGRLLDDAPNAFDEAEWTW
jgi:antitoxin MazE